MNKNIVYPRIMRVTYLPKRPSLATAIGNMHSEQQQVTETIEPITRDIACHATRSDSFFFHIAVLKRYDEKRDVPVWIYLLSIPHDLLLSAELISDDSEWAVPVDGLDLATLIPSGAAEN